MLHTRLYLQHPGIRVRTLLILPAVLFLALSLCPGPATAQQAPRVLVTVTEPVYQAIFEKIDRYVEDLCNAGYDATLWRPDSDYVHTAQDLRNDLMGCHGLGYAGCVFVGAWPTVKYEEEHGASWGGYLQFPVDLYFADLDAQWLDTNPFPDAQSGVFDGYTPGAHPGPEIIIGRIDPTNMSPLGEANTIQRISDYLDKLHTFYNGTMPRPYKGLGYMKVNWDTSIRLAYPDCETYSPAYTNGPDYLSRLASPSYEFVHLSVHGAPHAHDFDCRTDSVTSQQIKAVPPKPLFYDLGSCQVSDYTFRDCVSNSYIYNTSPTSLVVIGPSKVSFELLGEPFYRAIANHESIGQAFVDNSVDTATSNPQLFQTGHLGHMIHGDPFAIPFPVIHVTPSGDDADDGCTWATAKRTITAAIAAVPANLPEGEIWVAQGVYNENLVFPKAIKLYGGFEGTEQMLDQRDCAQNPTCIAPATGDAITVTGQAIRASRIDGFTIQHVEPATGRGIVCNASTVIVQNNSIAGNSGEYGAGIYSNQCTLTVKGNVISNNISARDGAGIYCQGGTLSMEGNTVSGNHAVGSGPRTSASGGGLCAVSAALTIRSSIFTGNSAIQIGGGMSADNCTGTLTGNVFSGNSGSIMAGGACAAGSPMTITGNTFAGNDSPWGSGLLCSGFGPAPTVTGNTFTGNTGSAALACDNSDAAVSNNTINGNPGGGVFCFACSPSITKNTISGNTPTGSTGGGISLMQAWPAIVNNVIRGNTAALGGGIGCDDSCAPSVINNMIVDNAAVNGGGVYSTASTPVFKNNIIAFNSSGLAHAGFGSVTSNYNDVFGNTGGDYSGVTPGPNDISVDPVFADRTSGDLHILNTSRCIDAGDNAVAPPTDMDGIRRPYDGDGDGIPRADIGAYEVRRLYVKWNSPGPSFNGRTWATAFHSTQEAVNAAIPGDEIWVAEGTYSQGMEMKEGILVYGGFAGTETARNQRNCAAHETIINAALGGAVYYCELSDPTTLVDGFTLRSNGCGVTFDNSRGSLQNNKITGNAGGGVRCIGEFAAPSIIGNEITGNNGTNGAGIYVGFDARPLIARNTITGNEATCSGGAVFSEQARPVIVNNLISHNTAVTTGGIHINRGGGPGELEIRNNTICDNVGLDVFGGITLDNVNAILRNNIVAFNAWGIVAIDQPELTCSYNDVYGNGGNDYDGITYPCDDISFAPQFVDKENGNFHLLGSSPCIDAGTDFEAPWDDLDGSARPYDGDGNGTATTDIGAYEYR